MNAQCDPPGHSDGFRLHYVQDNQRCVISYDSLDAALESARTRLDKNPRLGLWITDATKRVLLSDAEIRARLAGGNPTG
jgi:hypothetical protein